MKGVHCGMGDSASQRHIRSRRPIQPGARTPSPLMSSVGTRVMLREILHEKAS